jgi:hypothetical protein
VPSTDAGSSRSTAINIALALVGGVLLLVTVRSVGWTSVQEGIQKVGWAFPLILLLGGVRFAARSRGWIACVGDSSLRFRDAFAATLAGDALGNLTPLGILASEPAKVFFVRARLATVQAVASVAAENAFYIASVVVMLAAGAAVFFGKAELPAPLRLGVQAVLAGAVIGGAVGVWMARRRPAVLSQVARLVARLTGREASSIDRLREIEVHFYALLTWPASRIAHVLLWEACFHIAAVAEVYLVVKLLPGGTAATLSDAFVLETAGRLIVVAFKFVPYRLGVDEAGSGLVASALALDPTIGVTLALVRRVRVLFWNAIGLVLLAVKRPG